MKNFVSGPFNLNSLVNKVNDIYRLDDCINDGKQNISYSLFCLSAVSNEERKSIVRNFKSKPCQAVYNNIFVDDIPTELSSLEKLKQILIIVQRIVFEKIVIFQKANKERLRELSVMCQLNVTRLAKLYHVHLKVLGLFC